MVRLTEGSKETASFSVLVASLLDVLVAALPLEKVLVTFATFGAPLEHDCVELHAVWDPDQAPLLAVGHAAFHTAALAVLVLWRWS